MSARDRWTDVTGYRRGERDEVSPSTWAWRGPRLDMYVMITRWDGEPPSAWFLVCSNVAIVQRKLAASNVDAAKVEALALVRARLAAMLADLDAGEAT